MSGDVRIFGYFNQEGEDDARCEVSLTQLPPERAGSKKLNLQEKAVELLERGIQMPPAPDICLIIEAERGSFKLTLSATAFSILMMPTRAPW